MSEQVKGMVFRASTLSVDEKTSAIAVSVSSELPYQRFMADPETGNYVDCYEVLGHREGEIDFSRMTDGLVIQDTHHGDQIGLMRSPRIEDGKLVGEVEFCAGERADNIKSDAIKGLRRNMSVGYLVNKYERAGVAQDGFPIFRVVSWTPYEASFVNVPADPTIGVGREASVNTPAAVHAATTRKAVPIMDTPDQKKELTAAQVTEAFRLASAAHMENAEVRDLVESGKAFEEVKSTLLDRLEAYQKELAKKPAEAPKANGEKSAIFDEKTERKIRQRYSIHNAILSICAARGLELGKFDDGFEREVSQEIAAKRGKTPQGLFLPDFVRDVTSVDGQETLGRPAHGVLEGIGGNGSALVETNLMLGNFIEALRDTLVLRTQAGAQTLTGLVGNIAIPKQGKTAQAAWITQEGGDATKTNVTFGQISATPHTCGAYSDITRQLLTQTSFDVQSFVTRELVQALAYALEDAAFNGDGEDGTPTGLLDQITSAYTKAWAATPTFDKLIELIALARKANTYTPSFRFIGDTGVWSKLATTRDYETVENTGKTGIAAIGGTNRLLDINTSKVIGRDFIESHLMPAKTLLFGDFSNLMFCLWSGTDLVVDPYSNCTNGGIRVVALQDADILVRRPEAFSKATGVHD